MAISIGLVGAGRRAAGAYAPTLASCPGVRFAGVWARSPDAARRLADQHGCLRTAATTTFSSSATPSLSRCRRRQVDLAAFAAKRAKAVLIEKPIAGDLAGAEEL